jgi:hypothetical protein
MRPTTTSSGHILGIRPIGDPCASQVPLKIMCIGDSWTDDAGFPGALGTGIRAGLGQRLTDIGISPTWVGPFGGGTHAGVGGATLTSINASVAGWLTTYTPEICIVHAGLNDARAAASGATINTRWQTLLATMFTARPAMRVVVCLIPETNGDSARQYINAANALLPATFSASGYGTNNLLRVANLRGCVPTMSSLDVVDTVPHPSRLSYERIADSIWPTLLNASGRNAEW